MRNPSVLALAALLVTLAPACDGGVTTTSGPSAGSAGSAASAGSGPGGQGGSAATAGQSGSTTSGGTAGSSAGGTGGAAGSGAAMAFVPTPADIDYGADTPLPVGESILFNDWNPSPNTVSAMRPDGSGAQKVFHAYRVWSMGAAPGGGRVAFACGDPKQEEHYGLTLGDAIQHSWLYDNDTQKADLLAHGNINDECHLFGPGEKYLYLCRRYDFQPDFTNKGYRLGRISLQDLAFEFLSPENTKDLDIDPAPTADESALLFTRITITAGKQKRFVSSEPLPPGNITDLRGDAGSPRLSPDGMRYLYVDYTDMGSLWSSRLDGSDAVKVVNRPAGGARYSPDGQSVVYLLNDGGANCQHVEIAKADGSEVETPVRVRDCAMSGEFITEVDWVERKP